MVFTVQKKFKPRIATLLCIAFQFPLSNTTSINTSTPQIQTSNPQQQQQHPFFFFFFSHQTHSLQLLVAKTTRKKKNACSASLFSQCNTSYHYHNFSTIFFSNPRRTLSPSSQSRHRLRPDSCPRLLVRLRPNPMPLARHCLHSQPRHHPFPP